MAFDYWLASHAGSVFPPAIFQYDPKSGKYLVANKKFSGYIKSVLHKWYEVEDSDIRDRAFDIHGEMATRGRILYLLYAGDRVAAMDVFDREYDFPDRSRFTSELKKVIVRDPTYQAIYQGR